jgi:glyoxylase-like metal-dependent hydrolase (beta-lactamase superfamily II)
MVSARRSGQTKGMTGGVKTQGMPEQIARDVYWLPLGAGWQAVNVYLIGSGDEWCLVDAGWRKDAEEIRQAAAGLFGRASRPAAILLTHCHPDHAGAARELALDWDCDVWMHPSDLPLANPDECAVRECGGPLDRWVILPVMRLMGAERMQATLAKSHLGTVARGLDLETPPPGPLGWTVLHTPGHTPGHVVLVRAEDGVAVTGDALCTVDLNSPLRLLRRQPVLSGPPWITTWDWATARASAGDVAAGAPAVIAPGHGAPMAGAEVAWHVQEFLRRRQGGG